MRIRHLFRLVVAAVASSLLLADYFSAKPVDKQSAASSYRFAQGGTRSTISIEGDGNKVYVPVRLNQTGPYWFILDTGAEANVVDADVAKKLGLSLKNISDATGGGEGRLSRSVGSGVSIGVGDLDLTEPEVEVVSLNNAISATEGRRVDGLLGYNFFERVVVEIDYAQNQLTLYDPQTFRYVGRGEAIPFRVAGGNILVTAGIVMPGGKHLSGDFMLDTAWRSALTFTSPFVASKSLLASVPKTIEATSGMGIGGPTNDSLARVPRLQLGRYAIENFVAAFSHAKAGALSQNDFAGVIGAEILHRFKVVFDYPRHILFLEPNSAFSTPYVFDESGTFVIKDREHPTMFTIYSVVKNSPATEAGLLAGDLIDEIDNRGASNFSLAQVRQMFRGAEGNEHLLTVRRGDRVLKVGLTLRPLI